MSGRTVAMGEVEWRGKGNKKEKKRRTRQMGQSGGKRREGGRDGPPTLEHRERGVCFARCFYSGEARCRRTVCLEVGQVSMTVPQSLYGLCLGTCMRVPSQPMHMHRCYPSVQRACCALLSFNYARRTLFSRARFFHPLPLPTCLGSSSSDVRSSFPFPDHPSFSLFLHLLSVIFARIQRKESSLGTARSSFSFFLHFDQVTRELIRTSPPVRKNGEGTTMSNPVDGAGKDSGTRGF